MTEVITLGQQQNRQKSQLFIFVNMITHRKLIHFQKQILAEM
jgi:hypothetical protein